MNQRIDVGGNSDERSYTTFSGSSPPNDVLDEDDMEALISVVRTLREWRDKGGGNEAETDTLEPKGSGNSNDNKSQ